MAIELIFLYYQTFKKVAAATYLPIACGYLDDGKSQNKRHTHIYLEFRKPMMYINLGEDGRCSIVLSECRKSVGALSVASCIYIHI